MAQAGTGFFARLFRRRRRGDDFEPSLAHALAATARKSLQRVTGKELPARCEPLPVEALLEELLKRPSGWMTRFFQDSSSSWLIFLMPDDWLGALAALAPEEEGKKVPHMVSSLCDAAADFLKFETPVSFHRVQDTYARGDQQALMWRISETAPFKVVTGDSGQDSFYACILEETARSFEDSLQTSHAQDMLRTWLREKPATAPTKPSDTLKLLSPRELFLGNLYLPPRTECGTQTLETLCTTLSAAQGARPDTNAPGIWAACACTLADPADPKRLAHWYFFPTADEAAAARARETYKEIAGCLFRGALPILGEALGGRLEKPALGLDVKPDFSGRTRHLLLKAVMRLASVRMPVEVYVDAAALGPLLRRHCSPEGLAETARGAVSALPLAMALNERLIAKRFHTFPGHFRDPQLGPDFFPFSGFSDLVTEHDLSIVLQNYLPRALAGRPLRRLYAWSEEAADPGAGALAGKNVRRRVVTPHLFDEEKLARHMSRQMRDGWQRESGQNLGTRDQYLRVNREVLLGIDRAARMKAALLSPRARFLLAEMILPPLRARARRTLQETTAAGIPFAALRTMSAPQAQRFLATQPDKTICLGLVGAEAELAIVRKHVSAARAERLEEDLLLARKQLDGGILEWDEAVQARQELERAARTMIQENAKEGSGTTKSGARRRGGRR
ncbi:MAG: hypothetical protein ACHQ1F_03405 [Spirochaetia bacterium]